MGNEIQTVHRELLQARLEDEKREISELEQVFKMAMQDCDEKIRELSMRTDMENIQSIVYQKQYQEAIRAQLDAALKDLQSNTYSSVHDYLKNCYDTGYIGVMYDMHNQGIPLIMPIDQNQVQKALEIDSKISKGLYIRLGEDVSELKTAIRAEISRGIANGSTWNQMAEKLCGRMVNTPFQKAINNSIRIARTEGHRVQNQAALDAQHTAKEKGADIVKQWDSTLDGRTRETHRELDGQVRELDEDFEIPSTKQTASAPGMFGDPAEDCNCRCALLQRARWALDESELDTLKERAEYFELDKSDSFEEYTEKFLDIDEKDIEEFEKKSYYKGAINGAYNNVNDPKGEKRDKHAELYYEELRNSKKEYIVDAIAKNTSISAEQVSKMFDHLLINEYELENGKARFDSDYYIAESLRRLREGKDIQEHDIILIQHEAMEYDLMNKEGIGYREAHSLTNKKYNYEKALNKWLDENEK